MFSFYPSATSSSLYLLLPSCLPHVSLPWGHLLMMLLLLVLPLALLKTKKQNWNIKTLKTVATILNRNKKFRGPEIWYMKKISICLFKHLMFEISSSTERTLTLFLESSRMFNINNTNKSCILMKRFIFPYQCMNFCHHFCSLRVAFILFQ